MCIICKASFAKTQTTREISFFNQTYLIYLFLFIYCGICRLHRYYFHTALDQIPNKVHAIWCILAMNHVELNLREMRTEEFLWMKRIALYQTLRV